MLKAMFEEKLNKVKPEKGGLEPKNREYYPNMYLNSDALPEIADWEVGEDYYLVVKVCQKSKSIREEDGKTKTMADFDIMEIGALDYEEPDTGMDAEGDDSMDEQQLKKKYLG